MLTARNSSSSSAVSTPTSPGLGSPIRNIDALRFDWGGSPTRTSHSGVWPLTTRSRSSGGTDDIRSMIPRLPLHLIPEFESQIPAAQGDAAGSLTDAHAPADVGVAVPMYQRGRSLLAHEGNCCRTDSRSTLHTAPEFMGPGFHARFRWPIFLVFSLNCALGLLSWSTVWTLPAATTTAASERLHISASQLDHLPLVFLIALALLIVPASAIIDRIRFTRAMFLPVTIQLIGMWVRFLDHVDRRGPGSNSVVGLFFHLNRRLYGTTSVFGAMFSEQFLCGAAAPFFVILQVRLVQHWFHESGKSVSVMAAALIYAAAIVTGINFPRLSMMALSSDAGHDDWVRCQLLIAAVGGAILGAILFVARRFGQSPALPISSSEPSEYSDSEGDDDSPRSVHDGNRLPPPRPPLHLYHSLSSVHPLKVKPGTPASEPIHFPMPEDSRMSYLLSLFHLLHQHRFLMAACVFALALSRVVGLYSLSSRIVGTDKSFPNDFATQGSFVAFGGLLGSSVFIFRKLNSFLNTEYLIIGCSMISVLFYYVFSIQLGSTLVVCLLLGAIASIQLCSSFHYGLSMVTNHMYRQSAALFMFLMGAIFGMFFLASFYSFSKTAIVIGIAARKFFTFSGILETLFAVLLKLKQNSTSNLAC